MIKMLLHVSVVTIVLPIMICQLSANSLLIILIEMIVTGKQVIKSSQKSYQSLKINTMKTRFVWKVGKVFNCLEQYGLKLDVIRCELAFQQLEVL